MGWGKFDDAYPHHPKLLQVGAEGLALDVAAVCYANRYGTDGWVPDAMLAALYPPIRQPRKVADRLTAAGRWERGDGGWWIHDFADYNPTAAEVAERREKRAAAGRKGGMRSKPPSKPEASASTGASNRDEANGNPDPTPTPKEDQTHGAAAPSLLDPEDGFEAFWTAYPRRDGKPGGGGEKKPARQKWRRLKPTERKAAMAALPNYRAYVERPDTQHPKHAVTWLNQEAWESWQEPAVPDQVDNGMTRLANGQEIPL